jgi:ABC-2 type transport system permease protein
MRVMAGMILKDLRRKVRAPLGIGVILSFPLVFSAMLALTFGTGGDAAPRIRLLVENRDDNFIGGMLMNSLTSDQMAENLDVEVVGDEGAERMSRGDASALLRIPEGFTEAYLDGVPVALELIRNPAEGILPEVAEQLTGVLIEVLDSASRALRDPLESIAAIARDDAFEMTDEMITVTSLAVWHTLKGAGTLVFPPVITLKSVDLDAADTEDGGRGGFGSIFLAILPGISVYALFLVGDIGMRDLLTETKAGTLRRQLTGPIGTGTLIAGKALFTAVLSIISLTLLAVIGLLVSGGGVDLPGFILLSLSLVLAVTGAGAALYGAVGDESRGSTVGAVIFLVLAFAGGSFVPIDSLPATVRAIAPLSPFYWGTLGYRTLLRDGGGVPEILAAAGILAGIGVACLGLGTVLLRRRLRSRLA